MIFFPSVHSPEDQNMLIHRRGETLELPKSRLSSRDGNGCGTNSQSDAHDGRTSNPLINQTTSTVPNSGRRGVHISMPGQNLSLLQLDPDETNRKFNLISQTTSPSPSSTDAQLKVLWLEIFNEIYKESEELCNKVLSKIQQLILLKMPEGPEDFRVKAWLELLEKTPTILQQANLNQSKVPRMQRCSSLDSPRKILLEKPSTEEPEDSRVQAWLEMLLKKIPTILYQAMLKQSRVGMLQRSLSLESPRTPHRSGEESPMRLERFKVLTLDLGGVQQDGKEGTKSK